MKFENKSVVLVLDKLDYKKDYDKHVTILNKKYEQVQIVYTEYEDNLILRVRKWKYVGSFLQHIMYWIKSFNYARRIIRKGENSTIICINPIVGIFLGLMNRKSKAKVVLCGFLFEPKSNKIYYEMRKKFTRNCLEGISTAIVYASQEVDYYKKEFPKIDKFKFVQYGIDYLMEEEYKGVLPDSYIFSGGGSNRDYKTLIEAYKLFRKVSHIPLCIATLPRHLEGLYTTDITVLTDVVLETFGDVMRKSKLLVLSLKDNDLSAGHQVMLQALKDNIPILVNRIRAVEDYVSEQQVTFYESGNAEDMYGKLLKIDKKREMNKNIYNEMYTFSCLLERLITFG